MAAEQGFATIPRSLLHDPAVPRDAKLVYLMLSSHVGGKASAWPSHKRMAELLGMSVSTVKRQLHWLRDKGHISWQARIGDNEARITNEYVLLVGSSASTDSVGPAANKPSSVRTGGSVGPTPSSDGTTPQSSESEPLVPPDLTEEESLNESQLTNTSSSTEVAEIRRDVERICNRLADRIQSNGSKRPTIRDAWRVDARLLLDRDKRAEEEINQVIDWCQQDTFWRSNILSVPKLREKFDQLRLRMTQPTGARQQETDTLFENAARRMGVIS